MVVSPKKKLAAIEWGIAVCVGLLIVWLVAAMATAQWVENQMP